MEKTIKEELEWLQQASVSQLKQHWMLYFKEPPVITRKSFMMQRLAYKIQSKAHGGLPKTIANKIQRMAEQGQVRPRDAFTLNAGSRLVREYKGKRIFVDVLEYGYRHNGRDYKSLTAIATELMGSRTSGPKFFGLVGGANG